MRKSLVTPAVMVMLGTAALLGAAPAVAGTTTTQVNISPQTPVIASGAQGEVTFSVTGTDVAGNAFSPLNTAAFGIDGQVPVITFTIGNAGASGVTTNYPNDGANCVTAHDSSFYCGHDGSHFLRAGDANVLTFTVSDSTGASDKGSGALAMDQ